MQSRARGGDDLRTATIDALYNDVGMATESMAPFAHPHEPALEPPPPGGSELPSSDTSRVPGDVFPRLEFKYPLLWYHSRFAWSAAEQECTLRARATVSTKLEMPISTTGRASF